LLFADDSQLFFKLNGEHAKHIKEVLLVFGKGTGQQLSPTKCSVLVREGAGPESANEVKRILNVERVDFDVKYLGLPVPEGRMKRGVFNSIKEKYAKRMSGWNERLMSQVAKEVLVKSVAQALPTYMMSIFKIPLGLCDDMEKQTRAFW
jgi:hypothetical protein